jgi:hypothetical protein
MRARPCEWGPGGLAAAEGWGWASSALRSDHSTDYTATRWLEIA